MPSSLPQNYHKLPPFLSLFRTGVAILMYHKIGLRPRGVRLRGLYVEPEVFIRQIEELKQSGFVTCFPGQANTAANGEGDLRVSLTFDDGFRNVFENALATLAQHQFKAVQFLVPNYIGRLNEWDLRVGEVPEPLMDAEQVRTWLASGHRIGSHTLSHPRLTRLSLRDAQEEIVASKKKLEDLFGVPVEDFCYPYGDWNEAVRDVVMEAGYRSACTTDFGVNTPEVEPLALRRIAVRHPTRSLKALQARLMGAGRKT